MLGLAAMGAKEGTVTGVDCGESSVGASPVGSDDGSTDGYNEGSLEMTVEGVSEGMELAKIARAVRVLFAPMTMEEFSVSTSMRAVSLPRVRV